MSFDTKGHIVFDRVSKSFGTLCVLNHVSLVLRAGEKNVLFGTSGVGKTTLIRMIAGLETPDEGSISNVPSACGQRVAMVFQEDRLCENLSVMANISLAQTQLRRTEKAAFERRISDALVQVGLGGFDKRVVAELSGGQRRRVAVLRAVMADADVLLFDEPLTGLDYHTKQEVMRFLLPYLEDKTLLWVTHEKEDAALLGTINRLELWGS